MGVHEKLCKIQTGIVCPKSKRNSFGKYNYRSTEDILSAAKDSLKANKCSLTLSDEVLFIEDRFYIKAVATITDSETGEKVSTSAYAREEKEKKGMDASQLTGSCSSYARKYALNALLLVDDSVDLDSDEAQHVQSGESKKHETKDKGKAQDKSQEKLAPKPSIENIAIEIENAKNKDEINKLYIFNRSFIEGLNEEDKNNLMSKFADKKSKL